MPLEHWSITPLGDRADSGGFLFRRTFDEVTNEPNSQKCRQRCKPRETEGSGGMGSLADELEKVKVGLPRSKTVSISRALSHPQGASTSGRWSQLQSPPRKWRLLDVRTKVDRRDHLTRSERSKNNNLYAPMVTKSNTLNSPQIAPQVEISIDAELNEFHAPVRQCSRGPP